MKAPGSLIFLSLTAAVLYGSVTASLDKNAVAQGEAVRLILRVEGTQITIPPFDTLCGVKVQRHEARTTLGDGEGAFQKAELHSYLFRPEADCTIKPIAVGVDGAESYSQPLRLKVDGSRSNAETAVVAELRIAKKELYVGEPFELELIVKRPEKMQMLPPAPPEMEHLWIKKVFGPDDTKEGNQSVATTRYLLAAQQPGNLQIYPAEVKIALDRQGVDSWGNSRPERSWESYSSNALQLTVKPLPAGVTLVGGFTLELAVDRKEIRAKVPLSAELIIRGNGNFEDIPAWQPEISGVEVFAGEPVLGKSGDGVTENLRQKVTFVAERDFTIPPVFLDYYDIEEGRVKRVQTAPAAVHVTGTATAAALPGKTETVAEKSRGMTMGRAAVIFLAGAITAVLFLLLRWRQKRKQPPYKAAADDYRQALRRLLRYKEEPDVPIMIGKLEELLYGEGKVQIDAKELKKLLKRYQD